MASYATAEDLASWFGVDSDVDFVLAAEAATEAASRAIDRICGRSFHRTEPESRWYTPRWWKDRWVVDIDDLASTDDLLVELDIDGAPGAEVTDYRLTPLNTRPWTSIEILPRSEVKPAGHAVRVLGRWGWAEVPTAITLATRILAAKLYERRQNPAGPLATKQVDDVRVGWSVTTDLDPDVVTIIAPYRRLWLAV